MEALQLLRWCRFASPSVLKGIFSAAELSNLLHSGLVKKHTRSGSLLLTAKGTALLQELNCDGGLSQTRNSYHSADIERRLQIARLAVTAYRAGINVFTSGVEELSYSPSWFLPSNSRGRGYNPWGNTRVAALAHLGDLFCDVHYVCPNIGKLPLIDELTTLNNHASRLKDLRRVFIFAGETYADVLKELEGSGDPMPTTKLIQYADAYHSLNLPVHLLSCDDTGSMQLQIMAVPDYRRRLAQITLKSHYRSPPEDIPSWDALFDGTPFVLAVDMDLRRIDAAICAAKERGHSRVALVALEGQGKPMLVSRYNGQATFYALTSDTLEELLGRTPTLYTPKRTQFLTAKGDVVDAPLIKADRKVGGSSG